MRAMYTFRTTFDLSGFNPSSAHLHLSLSADDNIAEIRLNGIASAFQRWFAANCIVRCILLDIASGFLPSINESRSS